MSIDRAGNPFAMLSWMAGLFICGDMMTEEMMGIIDELRQTLRKERERRRISQEKVAKRMGISSSFLSNLESGKRRIGLELLLDWCVKGLRLSPGRILEKWMRSFPFNYRKKPKRKKPSPEQRCIDCKTNEKKLLAKVLCIHCYNKYIEARHKEYAKVPGIGGWLIPRAAYDRRVYPRTKLTKKYLLEEYVSKNRSVRDIAKDCYCSTQTVYKKLAFHNISLRDKAYAKRMKYNEEFFASWSPKMAYVLGVICTDGCLFSGHVKYCTITQKEPELLRKVLDLMDSKARIYFSKQKVYGGRVSGSVHRVHIYSDKIYDDLIGLGLTPSKSHSIRFPEVPADHMRHFIRGCWDGDGSINISKYRNRKLVASFVSGSQDFIERLVEELYRIGVYRQDKDKDKAKYPLTIKKEKKIFVIRIVARECLKNFFRYLYDGVDESLYLKRKYEAFLQGLAPKPPTPRKTLTEKVGFSWKPLCQIMKEERKRSGLSQETVAAMMGISNSYISNLESGKRGLSWPLWIRWCSALRISPSYVIDRWQHICSFEEITTWQQNDNFAGRMARSKPGEK